jgi:SAM-dependent methyltransferase
MGDLTGKRVLDYGCGTGEITAQLALLGAEVVGFDLSPDQIEIARERADLDGVASRVTVFAADGEELNLPEEHFDYVVVVALLHHTDFGPVMDRIIRCLRPGGEAFIAEPVAFSTTLGWLRDRAPVAKIVSPDERQLNADDVSRIRSYFAYTTIRYFNVLGRLQRLFLGEPPVRSGWLAWGATKSIHYIDRLLLSLPGAWRTAGYVVIRGAKAHR